MKIKLMILAGILAQGSIAFAADVTWICDETTIDNAGDWNNTANWQGGVLPGAGDTAKFSKRVKISASQTIDCNLEASSGACLVIGENATVTLNGSYNVAGTGIEVLSGGKLITKGEISSTGQFGFNSEIKAAGGTWRIENASLTTGKLRCRGGTLEIATSSLDIPYFEYAVCKVKIDCDASLSGSMTVNNQPLEIDLNGHVLTLPNNFQYSGNNAAVTVKNGQEAAPGTVIYQGTSANSVNLKVCHDASVGKVNVVVDAPAVNLAAATFLPTSGFSAGGKWNGSLEFRQGEYAIDETAIAQNYEDYSALEKFTAKKIRWCIHSAQTMNDSENPNGYQYAGTGLAVAELELMCDGEPLPAAELAQAVKVYKLGSDGETAGEAIADPGSSGAKAAMMFDGNAGSKWYDPNVKDGGTYPNGLCVEFDFGASEKTFDGLRWAGADQRSRDPKGVELRIWDESSAAWTAVLGGRKDAEAVSAAGAWQNSFVQTPDIHAVAAKLPLTVASPAKLTVGFAAGTESAGVSGDGELTVAAGSAPVAVTMANGLAATVKSSADAARTINLGGALPVVGDASGLTGPVRFLKWEITASRGDNDIAIAEFELFKAGAKVAWPAGTAVSATKGEVYPSAPVERLIDGDLGGSGKVYFKTDNGQNKELTIALGAPMEFNGYAWYTSNDSPKRDPKTWTLSVSADGETWQQISSVDYVFPGDDLTEVPNPNNLPYGHKDQSYNLSQGRSKMVGVLDVNNVATPFAATVNYGTAAATDALDDAAAVIVPAGGELALYAAIETAGPLNGAGAVTMTSDSKLTLKLGAAAGAFSGTITGTGNGVLAIAGTGEQSLNGATLSGVKEIVLEGGTLTGAFTSATPVKVTFAGGAWGATLTMSGDAALTLAAQGVNQAAFRLPAEIGGEPPQLKAFDAAALDAASLAAFNAAVAVDIDPKYNLTKQVRGREYILKGSLKGLCIIIK